MEYVVALALVGGFVYFLYGKVMAAKKRRESQQSGGSGGGSPRDYDVHKR